MSAMQISRKTCFKGIRKVGLDTGMLVSLIDNEDLYSNYHLKLSEEKGILFTHQICIEEAVTVLTRNGFKPESAQKEVIKFLKHFNIEVIHKDKSNKNTVSWMFRECKSKGIDFHPPDCFIIADFYKNGINKIYSNNNHFLDACRLFGMDATKLTTPEKEIERQLKKMFKSRRR